MRRAMLVMTFMLTAAATWSAEPAAKKQAAEPVQTLDSITIEGDVAVPQVLFITSREHPRHREDLGRALRPDALTLARRVTGPTQLIVIDDCVSRTIKEQ